MDKEINIEEQSPVQDTSEGTTQLPINYLPVGTAEKDDVKVYVHQSVILALEAFARTDTKNELGSILLGTYSNALDQTAVIVSEYIEAKYTDASASTLTFTHETWDYVHKEQAEKWPDLRIVGWQHTHPGYGIFLSNYDMFIQENFFNLPFQIAYVIDPIQNTRGFFCWKNGHVEKLRGYYIYDEPGTIIVPPTEGENEPAVEKKGDLVNQMSQKKSYRGLIISLAIVCTLLIAAVTWLGLRLSESNAQIQELFSRQNTMQDQLKSYSLNQNTFNTDASKRMRSIDEELSDNNAQILAVQDRITELEKALEKADIESPISFLMITVNDGDTLMSICESLGIDYSTNAKMILGINGLSDENELVPEQMLLIPKYESIPVE